MRKLFILTATALGVAAGTSFANAQATNFAPVSGMAPALYGSSDAYHYRATRRSQPRSHRWHHRGYDSYGYVPRAGYRSTEGIPPALYHAGDPQYWR